MRGQRLEIINITNNRRLVISKVWDGEAWSYQVLKESTFFFFWVGGWGDGPSQYVNKVPIYKAPIFSTLEEAKKYALKIKNNFLENK